MRHPREGEDPSCNALGLDVAKAKSKWIPAFAGMTSEDGGPWAAVSFAVV
jgi:hypothetical protein